LKIFTWDKGVKIHSKDKFNREIGSYKDGKYDTIAVQGETYTTELLMLNFKNMEGQHGK
jgi:hypothetical protein